MAGALSDLVQWADRWQLSLSVDKCCVLNIGILQFDTILSVHGVVLPVVQSQRDLGVIVSRDLSPTNHINDIVVKAHRRANLILRAFESRDVCLLLRAFLVYVRPLLEYNSVLWSPCTIKDIQAIENVQRRFTKRLHGLKSFTYQERLIRLSISSLELRRLHADLILTYKILFGHVDLDVNLFEFCSAVSTRGHQFKLYKHRTNHSARSSFFCERIINVWNSLPSSVNFRSINTFKQSIGSVDFAVFLKCF